jgi:cob(I)alamin adenosyltransferase
MRPKSIGLIQVYTGGGKGKTTASLGLAIRAVGAGKRVAFFQFDKGGSHYSERQVLKGPLAGLLHHAAFGLDRIDPVSGRFRFGVTDEDRAEAERGLAAAVAAVSSGEFDLVVLDEFNTTVTLGMLAEAAARGMLDAKHPDVELVLTGRDAPAFVTDVADLITEVREVRHYFRKGVPAREGLDF